MSGRGAFLMAAALVSACSACNPSPKESRDAPTTPTSAVAIAITTAPSMAPSSAAPEAARTTGVRIVSASADTDAISLVRTERLKAKAEGRVLVVYAGATWCEPCKRFKEEVHTGHLDEKLPRVTLLAFDRPAARRYGTLRALLETRGTPIGIGRRTRVGRLSICEERGADDRASDESGGESVAR